jgi:hypothetical protein
MADYVVKRHDTFPALKATLSDENGPINLTSATRVKFIAASTTTSTPLVIEGECTIEEATGGVVAYPWAVGDLATAGTYNVEFQITWAGGGIESVPNTGYKTMLVEVDLG